MKKQINKLSDQRIKVETRNKIKPLFVAYTRKSSEEDNRQVLSISAQVDEIKNNFQTLKLSLSKKVIPQPRAEPDQSLQK